MERLHNYSTQIGGDPATVALATHLKSIIEHLDSGDFTAAYALLHDRAVAKQLKYRIRDEIAHIDGTNKAWGAVLDEAKGVLGKGMHFKGELILPDVIVVTGGDFATAKTPENDPTLASMVLPVDLEEWIHMFQTHIGGFLSEGTERFSQTPEIAANQQLPAGTAGRHDLKEVDIYAIYRDLGWNHILDDFRARYEGRGRYEEYAKAWAAKKPAGTPRGALIGNR